MGRKRLYVIVVLISIMSGGIGASPLLGAEKKTSEGESRTKDMSGKKEEGLAIKDLPAPIPKVIDEIQRIGNEVGEGISKATGEGTEAVKKAFRERNSE